MTTQTKESVTISINGIDFNVEPPEISHEDIIEAFSKNPNDSYDITYTEGALRHELVKSKSVIVSDGMSFTLSKVVS